VGERADKGSSIVIFVGAFQEDTLGQDEETPAP
jgi:hypothetical protein